MQKYIPTFPVVLLAGAIVFLLPAWFASAQNTNGPAAISKTTSNLLVSWTGIGSLQAAPAIAGLWQDILEASSPRRIAPTNTHGFFRVISRWSKRASLLDANSEMGVAELDGKIYVLGHSNPCLLPSTASLARPS